MILLTLQDVLKSLFADVHLVPGLPRNHKIGRGVENRRTVPSSKDEGAGTHLITHHLGIKAKLLCKAIHVLSAGHANNLQGGIGQDGVLEPFQAGADIGLRG